VTINNTATVTGTSGAGIIATGAGGLVKVDATNGGTITGGTGSAIVATNNGVGGVTVITGQTADAESTGGDGISATSNSGGKGNISITEDGGVGITSNTGAGVGGVGILANIVNGTGSITVNTGAGGAGVGTGEVLAEGDGIEATTSGSGSGATAGTKTGIAITTGSQVGSSGAPIGAFGVVGEITNAANGDNINVNIGGNQGVGGSGTAQVFATDTGVYTSTAGLGNISVTTQKGDSITSQTGDGIDAFAQGGNVTINLLDGSINSNTKYASGTNTGTTQGPTPPDPHSINASTIGNGVIIVNAEDTQTNANGAADLTTTVDGNNYVGISAKITNTGGDGVDASSSGKGNVIVSGFNTGNPLSPYFGDVPPSFPTGLITTTVSPADDGEATGEGVSAEITTNKGNDITATTSGSGSVFVTTIAGGTLEGNGTAAVNGVDAEANGTAGSVTVNIGDSIGDVGPAACSRRRGLTTSFRGTTASR